MKTYEAAVMTVVALAAQGIMAQNCSRDDSRSSFGFTITSDGQVGISYNYDSQAPGYVYYPPQQVVYYPAPQVVYYPSQPVVYCPPPVVQYPPRRPWRPHARYSPPRPAPQHRPPSVHRGPAPRPQPRPSSGRHNAPRR